MQKTLHALIELQKVDDRLDELKEERGDLPLIVQELEQKLQKRKDKNEQYEDEVKDSKLRLKELELLTSEAKEKLSKYNDQLYQVKTNREYDAITSEIEAVQEAQKEYEKEIKQLQVSIEEKVVNLSELETDISKVDEELSETKVELDSRMSETADEESKLLKARRSIVDKLKKSVLSTYETVRNARDGKGIAFVVNGNCGGCFSYIPPQKIVEIRKMKNIHECEFCGRILVWNDNTEK